MSTLFIDDREARAREQELLTTQTDYSALAPGKLEGLPSGLGQAVSRAGAGLFALGADIDPWTINGHLARAVASAFGRDLGAQQQDIAKRWLDDSRLDPATHGSVANILYGVGSFAPALAASAVNPLFGAAVAGGTTFEGSTSDLRASGVDADTAHLAAASDAAFATLGALLPGAFGTSRALNTLAIGPGINIAQDVASRYATASLLESNGYDELAGQYRHMDANTLIADAILGGGFGYLGAHAKQHEVDAAQVQQRIRAAMLAGPGAPVDGISLAKHAAALEKAQADLLSGRPVDVSGIEGAQFLRDPQNALAAVLERNGYHEEAAQIRDIEAQLAERQIATPDEEPLPDVPRPTAEPPPAPAAKPAKKAAKAKAAATESPGPKPEPLPPHEQAVVDTAQAIVADHATAAKTAPAGAGEGQGARDVIATPEGDVRAATAMARADRQLELFQKESVQFPAAVSCFLRHGA